VPLLLKRIEELEIKVRARDAELARLAEEMNVAQVTILTALEHSHISCMLYCFSFFFFFL
jgi:hypothetical protein